MELLFALCAVVLFVDEQRLMLKIHAVPRQTQKLALPQSGKRIDEQLDLISIALNGLQKRNHVRIVHCLKLRLFRARKNDRIQGILPQIVQLLRLFQRSVQNAMNIFDGLRRQTSFLQERIIDILHHRCSQLCQLYFSEIWLDMHPDVFLISAFGSRFDVAGIGLQPLIEPCAQLHGSRRNVCAAV